MCEKLFGPLSNVCRTCIRSKGATKRSLLKQNISEIPSGYVNGPTIIELLQTFQPDIEVHYDDNLPKIMCSKCVGKLQVSCEFLQMYKDNDKKLRKLLNELNQTDKFGDRIDKFQESSINQIKTDANKSQITKHQTEDESESVANYPEFEAMFIQTKLVENTKEDDNLIAKEISEMKSHDEPVKSDHLKIVKQDENIGNHLPLLPNENDSIPCLECTTLLPDNKVCQLHMKEYISRKSPKKRGRKKNSPQCFECKYCRKVFQHRSTYNIHASTHKGDLPYRCIECGKKIKNSYELDMHMLCHRGGRSECDYCGKDDKPRCLECGKEFKGSPGLKAHMLRHKGEKNIECPHCPRKFVCKSSLHGHLKQQHEVGKPHLCDICGKAFRMAYMLKTHKIWHSAVRKYPCEYCDKRFVTHEMQRRHMRTHSGLKPYCCKFCDRAYSQSTELNKHMKQHLGENIYQCELCPSRFPFANDVRTHFVTHKNDDAETRVRNLEARAEEEKVLLAKFGVKNVNG